VLRWTKNKAALKTTVVVSLKADHQTATNYVPNNIVGMNIWIIVLFLAVTGVDILLAEKIISRLRWRAAKKAFLQSPVR